MNNVVIFGIGDFAQVVHASLVHESPYDVAAFTVHSEYMKEPQLLGLPVVPFERVDESYPPDRYSMFVAMGYTGVNRARAKVYHQCKDAGYHFITYISPRASLLGSVTTGENCYVGDYAVIRTLSEIGEDVIIGGLCYIGQRTCIHDHCFISQNSSLSSNNDIGAYTFIGANATIRDGIRIAGGCVIGAGAVILRDTKENGVYKAPEAQLLGIESGDLRKI